VDAFSHLTERLLTLCGENAALVSFLGAFLESLIGLGALLPGGTMVVLSGFTIRDQGAGGFFLVAALAWAGMTLGSVLDFWLGRLAGRRLVPERAPWRLAARWRRVLRSSRRFMRRWGWWAIFVSNLAGPGRSSIAVASGASGWSFGSFLLGQSLAAAIWSSFFAGVGYFAAGEAERMQLMVSGAGVVVAAVVLLLLGAQFLASALLRMASRRLRPRPAPASVS
jgi:membrane protein DedA with SNARE-associated domain